jgi:formylglycine-generating enzyme required for sulfatase activity
MTRLSIFAIAVVALLFLVGSCIDQGNALPNDDDDNTTDDTADDDTSDDDTSDDDDDDAAPGDMVLVPGGPFPMGCGSPDDDRCGGDWRIVDVPAFFVDVLEVSADQFEQCIEAGACYSPGRPSPFDPDLPVQGVNWFQAGDYCAWLGKRLPSDAEWEKAARGDQGGHDYPWGDTFEPTWVNWCDGYECDGTIDGYVGASPVYTFPENLSPYGAQNMCGNVAEWTTTEVVPGMYGLRGGTYRPPNGMGSPEHGLLTWQPTHDPAERDGDHYGFRCVKDAK